MPGSHKKVLEGTLPPPPVVVCRKTLTPSYNAPNNLPRQPSYWPKPY